MRFLTGAFIPDHTTAGEMRKVAEYEAHAAQCRRMAAQMKNALHKKQLVEMAKAWETLAEARRLQLLKRANGDPIRAAGLESEGDRAQ